MAQPKQKELGGARNMRTSTKIIIGIFAVVMALSMMLPSLTAIFGSSQSTEAESESTVEEEADAEATSDEEAKEESKDEESKEDESKDEKSKEDKKSKDDDADPKVPDNESLKSLEETNSEEAKKYKDRLKENPENLAALYNLGQTYMNWGYSANNSATTDEEREYAKKLLDKATSYFDRYLKLNDSVTVKIDRALTQYYAGDTTAATDALKKVCDENPEDAIAQAQLGYLYESQYDVENATAAYRKAAELDPENTQGVKDYANQRVIALNSKVSSIGDPGDAAIDSTGSDEGQSELMQKIRENSDAVI